MSADLDWFVVRTNPQCEERARVSLEEAGFTVFKPRRIKEYQHNRSKRWITREFPLFIGYVFLGMPADGPQHFGRARACDGVKMILGSNPRDVRSHPIAIPGAVVADLLVCQEQGDFDELRPPPLVAHEFKQDDVVQITEGPLSGFEGRITNASGRQQIRVAAELFASLVEVVVPAKKLVRKAA